MSPDTNQQPLKILYAGTPETAVPPLEALHQDPRIEITAVLTREDAPVGRKKVMAPSAVGRRADELGLPVIKANRVRGELLDTLRDTGASIAAVVAYGALLPRPALEVFQDGWINLHFSLLPQWRGAAPVQRALMAGDSVVGATTFVLDDGMDTGPVVGTLTDEVRPEDTSGSVLDRLAHEGSPLLVESLLGVASGRVHPTPQRGESTAAPKLTAQDGRVDWSHPAVAVAHRVRGVTPEPGAWTELDGQRFKLDRVIPAPEITGIAPGHVELREKRVFVGTGSYAVELTRVQPNGKKPMAALDWARGKQNTEQVAFG
ncbi:methionyl-tRNA formyltransferase [Kocuria marina subsp. indica]|uniref:methionyl-tRNA formyltransferase n=1 Tax=Kocuria TaxID=57493 RepID=UPI00103A3E56|nr:MULTISPECIES: methionyl-tRNA formyltransferase [Kocuria]MDT0119873.1 methionyl-tRNA formyltransferase [Kocuria sp. PD6]QBJ21415.1 methionyl-tRNA formyltransferase [Kocuria indica]